MKSFSYKILLFAAFCLSWGRVFPHAPLETDTLAAQPVLTLDSCRALALANHKALRMAEEGVVKASEERKAAKTSYLPKLSATASYLYNSRRLALVGEEDRNALASTANMLGTSLSGMGQALGAMAQLQYQQTQNPAYLQVLQGLQQGAAGLENLPGVIDKVNEALQPDIHNMFVGVVSLTQPLYMGGKIRAYDRLTRYAEDLAGMKLDAQTQEVIYSVDEAYWQVVSLAGKKRLAESYLALLEKLSGDVEKMIKEGVATRADGLSVAVKVNEAEMTLSKVEDGLVLGRMLLCQICGLPIEGGVRIADEDSTDTAVLPEETMQAGEAVSLAMMKRPELKSLDLAGHIYEEKVKIARSELLPQLALTGNFLLTNPSLYNGFEHEFKGMWNVGVMMHLPLWNWGEGLHKVRAAKAEARISQLQQEEAREKIELQVNQAVFQVREARKKLLRAEKNRESAQENLRHASLGFAEGVIPSSTVLEAHTAWLQAETELLDASIEQKLTKVYLRKVTGVLE
ncbi:MAG: TolC family protein [Bacteroidaceae bacterium]|jgi:outer membrane protein TolC